MPIYTETNSVFDGATLASGLSDPVVVTADGVVFNKSAGDGRALSLLSGAYVATINGMVSSASKLAGSNAIFIDSTAIGLVSKINIGTTGDVMALAASAIQSSHTTSIVNLGHVSSQSGQPTILITANLAHTIANKGSIESIPGASLYLPVTELDMLASGYADAIVLQGSGLHTISNSGLIVGNVVTQAGATVVTNSGKIIGSLATGSGNDKVSNTGLISGAVTLGAGDDSYTGSKGSDFVVDNSGKDTYKLGDGIDIFLANLNGASDSVDVVDGGGHAADHRANPLTVIDKNYAASFPIGDVYFMESGPGNEGVNINLGSKAITSNPVMPGNYAAGLATGEQVGTDVVKNFEVVYLGTGNDNIFGSAVANFLSGGDGIDAIFGGAGNDVIVGGMGPDLLGGDLGADDIYCSDLAHSADGFMNTIFFLSLKDSTVALSGRDRIHDFVHTLDRISLEFLYLSAEPNLVFNGAFSVASEVPELRILETGMGWTIQLDVNGDQKADMAFDVVDVVHEIAWEIFDFSW